MEIAEKAEYMKRWWKNHPDYKKKWYKKHPNWANDYYRKNRERLLPLQKNYRRKAYKKHSKTIADLKMRGCAICGYNKCTAALSFHHANPEDKKFLVNITSFQHRNTKDFVAELNKCILLCCRCHREIEFCGGFK